MKLRETPRTLKSITLMAPLALHVIPTLVIGFGIVIPGSPIAGLNQYTIGFSASVLGFIPVYVVGLRLCACAGRPIDD